MCPDSSGDSPSNPASAGKALLSKGLAKLTSPFAPKPRNFTDFYIEPDEPYRQYSPGDRVTGTVVLTVVKPLRITHLVASLYGYAQVFRNPNSPSAAREREYLQPRSGKKKSQYFGNGFAALFKDEVVLCGEGRLAEGIYKFNFELDFPNYALPSSIDFERGTISYVITSTLTRPTAIMPTATCERKVYLIDDIDIAPLAEPKPRVVSVEAISRRYKVRNHAKKRRKDTEEDLKGVQEQNHDQGHGAPVSEVSSSNDAVERLQSPAPSEVSSESTFTASMVGSPLSPTRSSVTNGSARTSSYKPGTTPTTITAKVELQEPGCLRGDNVTVKVTIQHVKAVRSVHGIIATLYRQARVDMRPALPIDEGGKGQKPKFENYYAKSKTGLGGLSLSDAGSSHVFRKDLSQSFAPLLVDPRTLMTEVKATVRVPEEAFPTIATVPGAMIDFTYHVEVVVDLHGKLAAQNSFLPSVGIGGIDPGSGPSSSGQRSEDAGGSLGALGGGIVNTDQLRRDKHVVTQVFEVTVGTRDSSRKRGKQKETADFEPSPYETMGGRIESPHPEGGRYDEYTEGWHETSEWEQQVPGQTYDRYQQHAEERYHGPTQGAPPLIPPPRVMLDDGLDEKARARLAEERLYPSEPPAENAAEGPSASVHAPSTPDNMENFINSARPIMVPYDSGSAAPSYQDAVGASPPSATDDKLDIRRQRLQLEASAPPQTPEREEPDYPLDSRGLEFSPDSEPSAPPISLDDSYQAEGSR